MYAVNGKHATPNIFLLNIKYLPIILFLKVEVNSGGYLPSCEAAREISTNFTDGEVNNCFNIYHTI